MEKYKVTIEKIIEVEGEKYPSKETIYEQIFTSKNNTEIENVIKSVNNLTVTY